MITTRAPSAILSLQCRTSQASREGTTVAQVHPVALGRTSFRQAKAPAGPAQEGHDGGPIDHLGVGHLREVGLGHSHQEGGTQEWKEAGEAEVQSRLGRIGQGFHAEALFVLLSSPRGRGHRVTLAEQRGREA